MGQFDCRGIASAPRDRKRSPHSHAEARLDYSLIRRQNTKLGMGQGEMSRPSAHLLRPRDGFVSGHLLISLAVAKFLRPQWKDHLFGS